MAAVSGHRPPRPTPARARATGTTVNFPLPAGATGDVYLDAIDTVVEPLAERFAPTWVLVSAGFDAHRADPLTGLGLSAGDYVDLTARIMALAPARRLVVFLEGGYDLDALRDSTAATVSTLLGPPERVEPATGERPGPHRGRTRSAISTPPARSPRLSRRRIGAIPGRRGSRGGARVPIDNG